MCLLKLKYNNKNMIKNIFKGKNLIILILGILIIILAGGLVYSQKSLFSKAMSSQKVVDSAIDYVNKNLLKEGTRAELVGEVKKQNGLYKFQMEIGSQRFDAYVTKDGSLLFPQAIKIKGKDKKTACQDIKKEKTPKLEAFVVSYCPYGTQMERILGEIVKNVPELKENIEIRYIGSIKEGKITSMHGDKEAQENLRQICLREEQRDKFFPYLACFLKQGKSDDCLASENIDKEKLSKCMEDESKGLAYAKKDFDAQKEYQVTGSPSLFLNGEKASEFDFGGRTAQAVKNLLCCGFKKKPKFCLKELSDEEAAIGFSLHYSSTGSNGGSCK